MGHVYASLEDVSNGCAVDSATRDAATLAQFQHDGSAPPVARWRGTGQTSRNAQALGRVHALTRDAGTLTVGVMAQKPTLLMLPPQTVTTRAWAARLGAAVPELSIVVAEDDDAALKE